ncbi:MAG TPA: long-chain fatty acid--CoA ligase [Pyrinomonadaceae bacterium]|nr:long-chain fatty acid--CoA ligase [Pyrinomonadaceae bacterium]
MSDKLQFVAPNLMSATSDKLKFVEHRAPLMSNEPTTLVELYDRIATEHPKSNTLNYKRDGAWHSLSAAEMLRRARHVALGLNALGIRKGDRVAIVSESCVEWALADQGCIFAGAITVPIYPTLTAEQARYIINDCGARAIFVATQHKLSEVDAALKACPTIETVILFESQTPPESKDVLSFDQLRERGRALGESDAALINNLAAACRPQDLATIIYTSGTTGEPKGVMLTHVNMVSNLIDSSNHLEFGEADCALSVLPLSHSFERQAMNMYLHHGMSVYFGSIETLGENLREVHPTVFVGVPRIYEKIIQRVQDRAAEKGEWNAAVVTWAIDVARAWARRKSNRQHISLWLWLKHKLGDILVFEKLRKAMGGRIRILVSGGAPLSDDVALAFLGAALPIVQGYGLTETSPVISADQVNDIRIGTSGKPIRNVEVRIAADGEIETRGPNVMQGYWHKLEETRAVMTDDGWFKTGDIGHLDADGYLTITDRKKELLKTSGGKYIAPQPIEQLIKGSRFVNQVVIVGDGRKFPAALIVPDWHQLEGYAKYKGLDLHTRADFCHSPRIIDLFERQIAARTQGLAQFERIKKIALLEHELTAEGGEMTPTLKLKRRVVDEKYRELIDRLYLDGGSDFNL